MDALIVAQVTELIRKMGQSGDAAGVATLFAHLAKIEGYTDTLEATLGANTDAPATNASIWAMLKTLNLSATKVDKSACVPFGNPAGSIALTTTYQTLQSITGKGYLDAAVIIGAPGGNSLRIKVDGVVVFEGSSNDGNNTAGLFKRELLMGNAVFINPGQPWSPKGFNPVAGFIFQYPYTANATLAQLLCITADSIYFNSSLLIEAKNITTPNTAGYYIAGGYQ